MTTDTPETDKAAYDLEEWIYGDESALEKVHIRFGVHADAEFARRLERERDEARAEVEKWKHHFITFACIHAAAYGKEHYGDGYMHPAHYDLLKEAGARMDDFKRAESNPPIMP